MLCKCGCGLLARPGGRGEYALGHKPPRTWFRIDERTGCHIWLRATGGDGRYGAKRWKGQTLPAHVFYWQREHGPVPDDAEVNHLCRNTLCVNVEHLELVTHQVNVQRGDRAKLSLKAVEEIRRLYRPRSPKIMKLLTTTFNISRYTIWDIVKRRTWANI